MSFDLNKTLEDVNNVISLQAKEKNIALAFDIQKNIPTCIIGNSGQLKQILINLLNNALKFTEQGEIGISIVKVSEGNKLITLRFIVKDTGIGIPEERKKSLFESFSQTDISTTRKYGGTGLGLSISWQLVEMMGGEMGVESELGIGSTFWFVLTFPKGVIAYDICSEASYVQQEKQKSIRGYISKQPHDVHILLVEDNAISQHVAISALSKMGFQAEIAKNGAIALDTLNEKTFDIILMDCQMPVMDGYETTRKIRAREKQSRTTSHLPIIAMTASAMVDDREKCLCAGMDDHIGKPIDFKLLQSTILKWMEARKEVSHTSNSEKSKQVSNTDNVYVLDTALGTHRHGGDLQLFIHSSQKFIEQYAQAGDDIKADLNFGHTQDAERMAHTVKGLAGLIGADKLTKISDQLETAISSTSGNVDNLLKIFGAELSQVVEKLSLFLTNNDAPGVERAFPKQANASVPTEQLQKKLQLFIELLDDDLEEAHNQFTRITPLLTDKKYLKSLNLIKHALEEYDTDTARSECLRISQRL